MAINLTICDCESIIMSCTKVLPFKNASISIQSIKFSVRTAKIDLI